MDHLKRIGFLTILAAVTIRATTKERWHGLLTVFFTQTILYTFFIQKFLIKIKILPCHFYLKVTLLYMFVKTLL